MNNRLQDLSQTKDRIKAYLRDYLTTNGHPLAANSRFRCINPEHVDNNPSCGIVPSSDDKYFHCFTCNISGDIFQAAALLEDKPLAGRGFISDNLMYLAKKYSIEIPEINLTEDELYEMDIYSAYHNAVAVIKKPTSQSDSVKGWLTDRGWVDTQIQKMGIGAVASYDDYIHRMTVNYKHKLEFLEAIDLTRKSIFNPDSIIFTVKDENGSPVGFAARNLRYEDQKEKYDKERKAILESEGEEFQVRGTLQAFQVL